MPEGCRLGRPRKTVDIERAKQLRSTGMALKAIAREMGMAPRSLRRAFDDDAGIPRERKPRKPRRPIIVQSASLAQIDAPSDGVATALAIAEQGHFIIIRAERPGERPRQIRLHWREANRLLYLLGENVGRRMEAMAKRRKRQVPLDVFGI